MATLTLTLDEIAPLLAENLPDPRVRDIHAHLNELRATFEQKIMGKIIHIPIAIRFVKYESPCLTVRLSVESKWGKKLLTTLLDLLMPDKEVQAGVNINGEVITFDLNRFLSARKMPFVITRIEPEGFHYQVDFKLDQQALRLP
ncbi:MAG: hypothetical protein K9N11_02370 [Lentisphaeria bacterium]|nr:hypothetical protein [Candidatus Neomarinimicrobiota bacterium]MCF7841674.1 hypothetical protein [Lentisphaeria bacterium]